MFLRVNISWACQLVLDRNTLNSIVNKRLSSGAEYTDCISTEGVRPPPTKECPKYDTKPPESQKCRVPPSIAITPILTKSASTS